MSVSVLTITLVVIVVLFLLWSYLVGREVYRGERMFFASLRGHADAICTSGVASIAAAARYLDERIIRLSWYYSVHRLLQTALRIVVSVYDYLERRFYRNRERARQLRAGRRSASSTALGKNASTTEGHLTMIAAHKEEVALTEKQKQKLKTKRLEKG